MIQPIESVFFPYSKAVVGHTIPGVLQRYPVITVNYNDLTSIRRGGQKEDPVKKFPGMNEDNAQGHSMMERLKAVLNGKQPAAHQFESIKEGYERLREDLGWRGVGHAGAGHARRAIQPPLAGFPGAGALGGLMGGMGAAIPGIPALGIPPPQMPPLEHG